MERWWRRFVVVVVMLVATMSLASALANKTVHAASERGASTEQHLSWDGMDRLYRLYVPTKLAKPTALMVMLHGGGGNAVQAERGYGWDTLADKTGFIVAYPQASGLAWNAGSCCGQPAATGVDDVGFIDAVVTEIQASHAIDPARIFVAGMSNGAMMAYRLACESTMFAAMASVSGDMMVSCAHPEPISILHIHGLADQNVPFDGSKGSGVGQVDGPPVPDVIAFWRQVDDCAAPTATTDGDVTTTTAQCSAGRTVELIAIAGAGHQWPTPNASAARVERRGADAPYAGLDATQTIWDFFSAHPEGA